MTNYGPTVEWNQLKTGERIFYTGDVCNQNGFGTITKRWHDEKWGYRFVNIRMDDGRRMRAVELSGFHNSPGRRFWLAEDYEAVRQQRIAESCAEMDRIAALRRQTA